jgi:hypothetical protein
MSRQLILGHCSIIVAHPPQAILAHRGRVNRDRKVVEVLLSSQGAHSSSMFGKLPCSRFEVGANSSVLD